MSESGHEAIPAKAVIELMKVFRESNSAAAAERGVYAKRCAAACEQWKIDPKAMAFIMQLDKMKDDRRSGVITAIQYMVDILEQSGHWPARTAELFEDEEKARVAAGMRDSGGFDRDDDGDGDGEVTEETMRAGIKTSEAAAAEPEKPAKGKPGRKPKEKVEAEAEKPTKGRPGRKPKAEPEAPVTTAPTTSETADAPVTAKPVTSLEERRAALRAAKAAKTAGGESDPIGLPPDANAVGGYRH